MWKWLAGAIALVVVAVLGLGFYLSDKIYIRFPHATVAAADLDRKYTPEQLRADFNALTATAEHIHPDIGAVTDATYPQLKARTLAALDHPMTRLEFWRLIAPAVGRGYSDGHTELMYPDEEWDAYKAAAGKAPPFSVRLENGKVLVERSLGAGPAPGDEIVSLDGVSERDLYLWLVETQSAETDATREAFAAPRFAVSLWAYGLRAPYRIEARTGGGAVRAYASPGIAVSQWVAGRSVGGADETSVTIENGVAHLVVSTFEEPWDQYQARLKAAFQKIHDAKARAVVLDLRQNTGGDTRQSDALQAYLSDEKLPALSSVEVKATPEVKAAYRTLLPPGFRWIPLNQMIPSLAGIQKAPDNGTFVFHPDGAQPTKRMFKQDLAFKGDVYLLISRLTYSTALIASAPYKHWKRAEVIGETTGEPMTFFGDYFAFDLPNTKLVMHVSHKRFVLFGSQGPHAGLAPDIAVPPGQDAYRVALDEIRRKQAVGR